MRWVEFETTTGKIKRRGFGQGNPIPRRDHAIAFISVDKATSTIECDSIDEKGIAINPRPIETTATTMTMDPIPLISVENQPAFITNREWQEILARLDALEAR